MVIVEDNLNNGELKPTLPPQAPVSPEVKGTSEQKAELHSSGELYTSQQLSTAASINGASSKDANGLNGNNQQLTNGAKKRKSRRGRKKSNAPADNRRDSTSSSTPSETDLATNAEMQQLVPEQPATSQLADSAVAASENIQTIMEDKPIQDDAVVSLPNKQDSADNQLIDFEIVSEATIETSSPMVAAPTEERPDATDVTQEFMPESDKESASEIVQLAAQTASQVAEKAAELVANLQATTEQLIDVSQPPDHKPDNLVTSKNAHLLDDFQPDIAQAEPILPTAASTQSQLISLELAQQEQSTANQSFVDQEPTEQHASQHPSNEKPLFDQSIAASLVAFEETTESATVKENKPATEAEKAHLQVEPSAVDHVLTKIGQEPRSAAESESVQPEEQAIESIPQIEQPKEEVATEQPASSIEPEPANTSQEAEPVVTKQAIETPVAETPVSVKSSAETAVATAADTVASSSSKDEPGLESVPELEPKSQAEKPELVLNVPENIEANLTSVDLSSPVKTNASDETVEPIAQRVSDQQPQQQAEPKASEQSTDKASASENVASPAAEATTDISTSECSKLETSQSATSSKSKTGRNKCIFCRIVAHEEKNAILEENDEFVVFTDHKPAASHHYLVTSRRHIPNAKSLTKDDIEYLERMKQIGQKVLSERLASEGKTITDVQVRFGFHWPPFTSVSHLHLHVIAPISEMGWISRQMFKPDSWWFMQHNTLINRLSK